MKNFLLLLMVALSFSCVPRQNNQTPSSSSSATETTSSAVEPSEDLGVAADKLAKNYYIVFDGSGSMGESACGSNSDKIVVAKEALVQFSTTIPEDVNLGLLVFDSNGITERLPLTLHTASVDAQFKQLVREVRTGGGTPLETSMEHGVKELQKQRTRQMGYGEFNLVVVTDGEANNGEDPRALVRQVTRDTPIQIHTIGFCIGTNHSLNQPGLTHYSSASNLEEIKDGLKGVLAESTTFDVKDFK